LLTDASHADAFDLRDQLDAFLGETDCVVDCGFGEDRALESGYWRGDVIGFESRGKGARDGINSDTDLPDYVVVQQVAHSVPPKIAALIIKRTDALAHLIRDEVAAVTIEPVFKLFTVIL
jgi:hypothetical protein